MHSSSAITAKIAHFQSLPRPKVRAFSCSPEVPGTASALPARSYPTDGRLLTGNPSSSRSCWLNNVAEAVERSEAGKEFHLSALCSHIFYAFIFPDRSTVFGQRNTRGLNLCSKLHAFFVVWHNASTCRLQHTTDGQVKHLGGGRRGGGACALCALRWQHT